MSSNTSPKQWSVYCCPYGARIAAPLVPWIIGYILFTVAAFGCTSFQAELQFQVDGLDEDEKPKIKFGYWGVDGGATDYIYDFYDLRTSHDSTYGCIEYVKEGLDDSLKTGRAIGIVGTVYGAISILLLLVTSFLTIPRPASLTFGIVTGAVMALFCGIMFIGLATKLCTNEESIFGDDSIDFKCVPAAKGYLLVPSFLLWIGGSIPLCICFKNPRPRNSIKSTASGQYPAEVFATGSHSNDIEVPQEQKPVFRPAQTARW